MLRQYPEPLTIQADAQRVVDHEDLLFELAVGGPYFTDLRRCALDEQCCSLLRDVSEKLALETGKRSRHDLLLHALSSRTERSTRKEIARINEIELILTQIN